MKKKVIIVIAAVLAVLIPIISLPVFALCAPAQFENLFTAAICDKIELLQSTEERKLIVVGGSSSPFGLRSDLLEEEIGMKVINLGVYASLGTKMMLDVSKCGINEGDIVLLAPEIDAQTFSLYFSGYDALQGFDGSFKYLSLLDSGDYGKITGALWKFATAKLGYLISGEAPDPEGIYNRASFNEYGDIEYPRPYNIMALGYEPSGTVSFDYGEIVSADFIDYLIEYARSCKNAGAQVYFTFAPVNALAVDEGVTQKEMFDFYKSLDAALSVEEDGAPLIKMISTPNTYVIESAYFYDTNMHLNDAGAILRTQRLAQDIKRALGDNSPVKIETPEAPQPPASSDSEEEWTTEGQTDPEYFVLRDDGNSYSIIGAKDEAKALSEIIVPTYYNGKRIKTIDKGAFRDCINLEKITVPVGITQIVGGAFENCPQLTGIYLHEKSSDILNVGSDLFFGVSDKCLIYLVNADISDFNNHYYWSQYADRMKTVK